MENRGTQSNAAMLAGATPNKQNATRSQEKAKSYLKEHNVEKILSEMLNSLVHARDPKPLIFMVKRRTKLKMLVDKIFSEPSYGLRFEGSRHRSERACTSKNPDHYLSQLRSVA